MCVLHIYEYVGKSIENKEYNINRENLAGT